MYRWARPIVILASLALCASPLFAKGMKAYQKGKLLDISEEHLAPRVVGSGGVVVSKNQTAVSYVVELNGIVYVGERVERGKGVAAPGAEWIIGDPIEIRFDKDKMLLARPNGKELETKIVKKSRAQKENPPTSSPNQ